VTSCQLPAASSQTGTGNWLLEAGYCVTWNVRGPPIGVTFSPARRPSVTV
jgi:hypothetical protein